jgi:hypothetical protein
LCTSWGKAPCCTTGNNRNYYDFFIHGTITIIGY